MNSFLSSLRPQLFSAAASKSNFSLVLCNEAGDLDSFVCAAVLAFHLNQKEKKMKWIPMINMPSRDLELHTEARLSHDLVTFVIFFALTLFRALRFLPTTPLHRPYRL
jgi:hypothetical protein